MMTCIYSFFSSFTLITYFTSVGIENTRFKNLNYNYFILLDLDLKTLGLGYGFRLLFILLDLGLKILGYKLGLQLLDFTGCEPNKTWTVI